MPVKTPSKKGTSPSPFIQRGIDQSWGKQNGTTSPQQALAQKTTKKPMKVGGGS